MTTLIIATGAALLGLAIEQALRRSPFVHTAPPSWASRSENWAPTAVVGLSLLFFAIYFSFHTVQQHYNLHTQSYDLAIFDNLFWNLLRGEWFVSTPAMGPTGSHIERHATFLAYLFAPLYALRQQADTLLVLQAVVVGAAVVPLFLLTRRVLNSAWAAVALVYAYVIFAPVHGPIFYDFHFLTLAPVFVLWVFYSFETGSKIALAVAVTAALLLREDIAPGLAMGFVFYFLKGHRRREAAGYAVLALLYFGLTKFVIMPLHSTGTADPSFVWLYQDLMPEGEFGVGAALRTVLTRPIYTLSTLVEQQKAVYVIELCAPLLFLPLRHRYAWVMLLVPAALTIGTTGYDPTIRTSFQYTAHWTPYVFIGAVYTLASLRSGPGGRERALAAVIALVVTSTAFSYSRGAILRQDGFRGGFRTVQLGTTGIDRERRTDLYRLIAQIPSDASVAATESLAPHVSNRRECFTMRYGHYDATFLLLEVNEAGRGVSEFATRRALGSREYGLVDTVGDFMLWKKGYSPSRNSLGYFLLGWSQTASVP